MDQHKWIHSIKKGNKKHIYDIAETYYTDVYRFCAFQTGSREDAYDLTQETFLRFIRYVENYQENNLKGYLLTIAMNLCRDYHRKKGMQAILLTPEELAGQPHIAPDPSPEQQTLHMESAEKLFRALKVLPEIQREAIILHYFHDLKYREISSLTGCSAATVKSRIKQGMDKLRKILKREDFFNAE